MKPLSQFTFVLVTIIPAMIFPEGALAHSRYSFTYDDDQECYNNNDCPSRSFCKIPSGGCMSNNYRGLRQAGRQKKYKKGKSDKHIIDIERNVRGYCEEIKSRCQRDYRPVCGCDGHEYSNSCTCEARGVSIAYHGPCSKP
jgi:hypothetical protein